MNNSQRSRGYLTEEQNKCNIDKDPVIDVTFVLLRNKSILQLLQNIIWHSNEEMFSVSLVVYLLTLRSACCLESWQKEFTVHHTLNGASLNILRQNPGKSLALAPFVFRFSLCKLATVATGETKKELLSFLEIKRPDDAKRCFGVIFNEIYSVMETDMTLFNKIYVNYTDVVNQTFMGDAPLYGVGVAKVGFQYKQGAVNFINNEMDARTYKRIRNVLDMSDINQNSSILLVNGVQIKPSWDRRFDLRKTGKKTFHLFNHTVIKIPMMNTIIDSCNYMKDEDELFSAISMPLAAFGLTATFVVTDPEKNIIDLLSILSQKPDTLESIKKRMKYEVVQVFLPKFRIKKAFDWTEYLRMVGLNLTLSNTRGDLNGILNKKTSYNMYVSKAKQKVFLDVDEMGSYRHGVGDVDMRDAISIGDFVNPRAVDVKQFVADRPFFFCISMTTRNGTKLDLVNGVYYGPDELDL